MRIFCVANQKGGVGKTTTAVALADTLAKTGAKTLLADFDPQCNATSGLGITPVLNTPLTAASAVPMTCPTRIPNLDMLPGCRNVAALNSLTATPAVYAVKQIQENLRQMMDGYEYVLFDCPPSLGRLTELALSVSSEILMPIQCEFFAMEGLVQMIEVIKNVMQRRSGGDLQFAGIVLTMYDAGLELTYEVEKEVRHFFGEIVFETVIPRDVAVSEAPSHALPVLEYAPRSRGARAYTELCMELI
ncbi:MAG: ParA family protein [Planctomycetaceae bacterium]|jgi:chromosome partitioning protein|nr:ParA family protein [Planctomycetaceae bacterium]